MLRKVQIRCASFMHVDRRSSVGYDLCAPWGSNSNLVLSVKGAPHRREPMNCHRTPCLTPIYLRSRRKSLETKLADNMRATTKESPLSSGDFARRARIPPSRILISLRVVSVVLRRNLVPSVKRPAAPVQL